MSVFVIRTLSLEWSGYRESAGEREREREREIGQTRFVAEMRVFFLAPGHEIIGKL
jgi:hypothetical protein